MWFRWSCEYSERTSVGDSFALYAGMLRDSTTGTYQKFLAWTFHIITRAILCDKVLRYTKKSLEGTNKMFHEAYGKASLSYPRVSRWLNAFKEGREEVHGEQNSGRPSTKPESVKMVANKVNLSSTVLNCY